jgi:hypothetical protein
MDQQPQPSPEHESSDDTLTSTNTAASPNRGTPRWLVFLKPKVGIPLAILIMLTAIPLGYRSARIASLPPVDEPFDVEAFCSVTIPDEENAFVEYREAFDLFVECTATSEDWNGLKSDDWETTPVAFKNWLLVNEKSLEVWLEGTKKPRACWVSRKDVSPFYFVYTANSRAMARLAVMKARQKLHQNDPKHAWSLLYSAFRYSRHIGQEGTVHERMIGVSILPIAASAILSWAHHSETTADDLEYAISALSNAYTEMTSPHSVALKCEYIEATKLMPEIKYGNEIFDDNLLVDSVAMFVLGEPEFSEAALAHVFKNHLAGVDQDLASRPPWVPGLPCLFDIPASSTHSITGGDLSKALTIAPAIAHRGWLPSLKQILEGRELERTFHSTMLAALAVERFVRIHARFPKSLGEELAVDTLQLLSDPQAKLHQQLIYRSNENYAVVYSVGMDGIDDGHSPQPPEEEPQGEWSQLRGSPREWFEGFRIPLWRPASDLVTEENAAVVPDNVQD